MAAHNSSTHLSTKSSPYFLLTGQEFRLPLDAKLRPNCEDMELVQRLRRLEEIREETIKNLPDIQEKQRNYSNKSRIQPPFKVGDYVLMHLPNPNPNVCHKLRIKYSGPFRIVEQISPSRYRIDTGKRGKDKFAIVQADRLKKYTPR
nr:PREDICTED: uncharacterized protein LOC109037194 [Bemisia tabaci]